MHLKVPVWQMQIWVDPKVCPAVAGIGVHVRVAPRDGEIPILQSRIVMIITTTCALPSYQAQIRAIPSRQACSEHHNYGSPT